LERILLGLIPTRPPYAMGHNGADRCGPWSFSA
jgi:hypothetical protein